MRRPLYRTLAALSLLLLLGASAARAASPSAGDALKLVPVQKEVDFDQPMPDEIAQCTISTRKFNGKVGWVVENPNGMLLRCFIDNNGDNIVDQWSYYKDGLEVYRDIDSDFNRKADQARWFHTAGGRWGIDKDEDGVIDVWKSISAEELSAEVVAALAAKDAARFERLVLSPAEVEALGLGDEKVSQLAKRLETAASEFAKLANEQKTVAPGAKWLQMTATGPAVVPSGTDGATDDIHVYENVTAIVDSGGTTGEVFVGTLVRVDDAWRTTGAPRLDPDDAGKFAAGFFFQPALGSQQPRPTAGGPSEAFQALLTDLEKIDEAIHKADSPEEKAKFNTQRADLVEKIAEAADRPEDRAMWLRQLADTVNAAVQSGTYPDGGRRLGQLYEKLREEASDADLAAHVRFRQLSADYVLGFQAPKPDYQKIQEKWMADLEQFAADYPKSSETAEALLQLAMAEEFAGDEEKAAKWYGQVVANFPDSPQAKKAGGAQTRFGCVGKQITLRGTAVGGKPVDLAELLGKVVLVQYWATWCERAKTDMAVLKDLAKKYGRDFAVIGVSLDSRPADLAAYLKENPLPWPQLYEEGSLDSRLANEMGIATVPTMILVDKQGKVVRRAIETSELDQEIRKLVR